MDPFRHPIPESMAKEQAEIEQLHREVMVNMQRALTSSDLYEASKYAGQVSKDFPTLVWRKVVLGKLMERWLMICPASITVTIQELEKLGKKP